jgi:Prealbumin-like fold domain
MKIRYLLLICLLASSAPAAHACQCIGPGPTCQSFFGSSDVFAGRVVSIEKLPLYTSISPNVIVSGGGVLVHFAVDEVFRGAANDKETKETVVREGNGCDFQFEIGRKYIVYGSQDDKTKPIYTNFCTRTAPLENAQADITLLRSLKSAPPGSRIYGSIQADKVLYDTRPEDHVPLANQTVTITGETRQSFTQTTDDAGQFNFTDLTPGKYIVRGTVPGGRIALTPQQVTVIDRGCAEVDFHTWWDGRIRGHVRNYVGLPVAGVYVGIANASEQGQARMRRLNSAITDRYGAYEIRAVQPGTYLIVVDARDPRAFLGDPIAFYPDATVSNDAKKLILGEATIKEGVDIALPKPEKSGQ